MAISNPNLFPIIVITSLIIRLLIKQSLASINSTYSKAFSCNESLSLTKAIIKEASLEIFNSFLILEGIIFINFSYSYINHKNTPINMYIQGVNNILPSNL